jgi:hypothetical protein
MQREKLSPQVKECKGHVARESENLELDEHGGLEEGIVQGDDHGVKGQGED